MMSTYLVVRTHGMITRLLPPDIISQLAYAKDLRDVISILTMTDYRNYLDRVETLSAESLYHIFKKVLINRFEKVISIAKGVYRDFLIEYARIFEIENILMILVHKFSKEPIDPKKLLILSFSKVDYDALINATDFDTAVKILRNDPIYYKIRDEIVSLAREYASILPIEYELYRIRYERIFKLLKRKEFIGIRKSLENIFGLEIDILNIFIVLSPFVYEYTPSLIASLLLPLGLELHLNKLKKILEEKRRSEIIEYLRSYANIVEYILAKTDADAYILAQKMIRERLLKDKIPNFTNIFYVILYLKACEYEFRDLSLIIHAIEYNIPRNKVITKLINSP